MDCLSAFSTLHIFRHDEARLAFHPPTLGLFKISAALADVLLDLGERQLKPAAVPGALTKQLEQLGKLIEQSVQSRKSTLATHVSPEVDISLHVSNDCNMRCSYCYASSGTYGRQPRRAMDCDLARRAIDVMYRNFPMVRRVKFFGGEPLLALGTIEAACEHIAKKHSRGEIKSLPSLSLVTNGTLLTGKAVEVIRRHGITTCVSVDGPKEIHDLQRRFKDGRGSFDAIRRGLERIRLATNQSPLIEATYTRMHLNHGMRYTDLIDYLKQEFHYTVGTVAPVRVPEDDPLSLPLGTARADWKSGFAQAMQDLAQERTPSIDSSHLSAIFAVTLKQSSRFLCTAGNHSYSITTEGDVYPCQLFIDRDDYCMGSIADFDINRPSPQMQKVGDLLAFADKESNPLCRKCFARALCTGCIGDRSFLLSDRAPPPNFCEETRRSTEFILGQLFDLRSNPQSWASFKSGLKSLAKSSAAAQDLQV